MWIVKLALGRPYTFIMAALLICIMGPLAILNTPKDIFPEIRIPVVGVVWNYAGLPAREMADRITSTFERVAPTTVNNVEHVESNSLNGVAVTKLFFHPGSNINLSMAQATAFAQYWLHNLPPGTQPPLILSYNASSVPVLQLALSSKTIPEQGLYDTANIYVRSQLSGVPGASLPFPYGGKQRQVQVDLDPRALQSYGLSAEDVQKAIAAQNLIIPAGTEKIDQFEFVVHLNGSPTSVEDLNNLPIKTVKGATVYIHDVAHVRDGAPPQQNIVRVNGQHAVLMTVQKTGTASTLQIVNGVRGKLPSVRAGGPDGLQIHAVGDQSLFVKAAISGVVREALIAGALTAAMILLFLGSWRSTLIIAVSIPLSILVSIIALSALGETLNIMTLGGLALAVGILVDDATVAIESINTHLEQGEPVETAILNGAREIATPALVATLCICIVFLPMFFLSGVPKFLFAPMAEAIIFAMLASYVLSRTLVPTLAKLLLKPHSKEPGRGMAARFSRLQKRFEDGIDRLRERYRRLLVSAIEGRKILIPLSLGIALLSLGLMPALGSDFFPSVDSGQIKLHMRAHAGTRVEETARLADQVETEIRRSIPSSELDGIVDNIGLPVSGINLTYSTSAPTGSADADIYVTLKPGHHPTAGYVRRLRTELASRFPGVSFSFLPADIVSQILNFGAPSPVDVKIVGKNEAGNQLVAQKLLTAFRKIPGLADVHIQQDLDAPDFEVNVDRSRSRDLGLTQSDVANNLLISLSGSFQTEPTFWVDPKNGVSYPIVTQTPQTRLQSLDALRNTQITGGTGSRPDILGGLADIKRGVTPAVVTHFNGQPAVDIFATNADRDLGGVSHDIRRAIASVEKAGLPKGVSIKLGGQVTTMNTSFAQLFLGLAFAIVLVYMMIVVNFQSLLDALIIIAALPAAIAGIVWMLFATGTTLSVPALTGAIMCVGVATANSILVVSFARDRMRAGASPAAAALAAGVGRFRPVLMTALAMIMGMLPMAIGLGEGGEQNAPLGRAVIGGLIFATAATLLLVPAIFTQLHGRRRGPTPAPGSASGIPL